MTSVEVEVKVNEFNPLNAILLVGCVYEVAALLSRGRLKTITRIIKVIQRDVPLLGRVIGWLWCGYIAWHFLEPLED